MKKITIFTAATVLTLAITPYFNTHAMDTNTHSVDAIQIACHVCTFFNQVERDCCEMCETPLDYTIAPLQQETSALSSTTPQEILPSTPTTATSAPASMEQTPPLTTSHDANQGKQCSRCNTINYGRRYYCGLCRTELPNQEEVRKEESTHEIEMPQSSSVIPSNKRKHLEGIACIACTFINQLNKKQCELCTTPLSVTPTNNRSRRTRVTRTAAFTNQTSNTNTNPTVDKQNQPKQEQQPDEEKPCGRCKFVNRTWERHCEVCPAPFDGERVNGVLRRVPAKRPAPMAASSDDHTTSNKRQKHTSHETPEHAFLTDTSSLDDTIELTGDMSPLSNNAYTPNAYTPDLFDNSLFCEESLSLNTLPEPDPFDIPFAHHGRLDLFLDGNLMPNVTDLSDLNTMCDESCYPHEQNDGAPLAEFFLGDDELAKIIGSGTNYFDNNEFKDESFF